jgi:hypothetical protein
MVTGNRAFQFYSQLRNVELPVRSYVVPEAVDLLRSLRLREADLLLINWDAANQTLSDIYDRCRVAAIREVSV